MKNTMKLTFTKRISLDLDKPRLKEVWPVSYNRYQVFNITQLEEIDDTHVNVVLDNGDVILEVPKTCYQIS